MLQKTLFIDNIYWYSIIILVYAIFLIISHEVVKTIPSRQFVVIVFLLKIIYKSFVWLNIFLDELNI